MNSGGGVGEWGRDRWGWVVSHSVSGKYCTPYSYLLFFLEKAKKHWKRPALHATKQENVSFISRYFLFVFRNTVMRSSMQIDAGTTYGTLGAVLRRKVYVKETYR